MPLKPMTWVGRIAFTMVPFAVRMFAMSAAGFESDGNSDQGDDK